MCGSELSRTDMTSPNTQIGFNSMLDIPAEICVFLDAFSHIYETVCPSARMYVRYPLSKNPTNHRKLNHSPTTSNHFYMRPRISGDAPLMSFCDFHFRIDRLTDIETTFKLKQESSYLYKNTNPRVSNNYF